MKRILTIVLVVVALQLVAVSAINAAPPAQSGGYGGGTYYTVQYGDTLFSIGRMFGVYPYYIAEVNGLSNPHLIYAGQVLYIPPGSGYPGGGCGNQGCGGCNPQPCQYPGYQQSSYYGGCGNQGCGGCNPYPCQYQQSSYYGGCGNQGCYNQGCGNQGCGYYGGGCGSQGCYNYGNYQNSYYGGCGNQGCYNQGCGGCYPHATPYQDWYNTPHVEPYQY